VSLRTYRAYTMTEALAAVRSDLGADAVILHTRSFAQGGFLGIGRRTVVEVTASAARDVEARESRRSAPRASAAPATTSRDADADEPAGEVLKLDRERTRLLAQAMAVTLEREKATTPRASAGAAAAANESATERATRPAAPPVASSAPVVSIAPSPVAQRFVLRAEHAAPPPSRNAEFEAHRSVPALSVRAPMPAPRPPAEPQAPRRQPTHDPVDLDAIDRLVGEVISKGDLASRVPPGRLADLYAGLLAQDVGKDLARRIVDDITAALSAEELANDHAVRSAAIERVARLLPACRTLAPGADGSWRRDARPLTVAFVGPTGVGKTTTVAKIAATLRLRHNVRVGLVTTDTYRVGAVDQLRTYADIIGSPLEVVLTVADMREAMERLVDRDVILIDTAGRSQNDGSRLGELSSLLVAAAPHETHLVLSSVANERALVREAEAFGTLGVDRVVLTKLDESAGLGAVMRVLRDVGHALSYITTGQEVPQHIEQASASRIAELVVQAARPTDAPPVRGHAGMEERGGRADTSRSEVRPERISFAAVSAEGGAP
jgi:flagellar biosynthesis protein FlhF